MRKRTNMYLAIAITTYCNYQCFYCKEGMFSLFLSSNLILHLSGCKNNSIQFKVREYGDEQIRRALESLLCLIQHDF